MIKTIKVISWALAANAFMYGINVVVRHYPEPTFVALSVAMWCIVLTLVCCFRAIDEAMK